MAVKFVRIPQHRYNNGNEAEEQIQNLKNEAKNFRGLSNHPNIVYFYGLCMNDGEAMICMELMDMCLHDLYTVVHKRNNKFPERILAYIAISVLEGLMYCKSKNYIHRDVKPKNILLNYKGEVKLCDFGASKILKNSLASTFVGTVAYWPPERFEDLKHLQYDVRADVWSLGITLAETAYGQLPFLNPDDKLPNREKSLSSNNLVVVQKFILKMDINELINTGWGQKSWNVENFSISVFFCTHHIFFTLENV